MIKHKVDCRKFDKPVIAVVCLCFWDAADRSKPAWRRGNVINRFPRWMCIELCSPKLESKPFVLKHILTIWENRPWFRPGVCKPVEKTQIVSVFCLVGHRPFLAAAPSAAVKATIGRVWPRACGCVPEVFFFFLQIQVTGWVWPVGLSLPASASGHKSLRHLEE